MHTIKRHSTVKKFIIIVLIAAVAGIFIKAFVIDAFTIPTGSMENTLLVGDFVIVNKLAYSLSTPRAIPIINEYVDSYRLIKFSEPERNDVIVFEFPGNKGELAPAVRVNYIKRVIGLPGDTVEIRKQVVYVNHSAMTDPPTIISDKVSLRKNFREPGMFMPGNFNRDNYGPVVVPGKGTTISLNTKNIDLWGMMINREFGRKAVSVEGTVITINGKPVREYTFQKDYFLVLGDNRDDSMDSRYWGYVPEDYIIGKALLIYWSLNPASKEFDFMNVFKTIRTERIFSLVK